MSFFSKWFGSNDVEEQKEVCFKEDGQENNLPNPQNLPEAMRYIVEKWGVEYFKTRGFLNILNDFHVLNEIPAANNLLLNMQSSGYIEQIIKVSNWKIESNSITLKYSTEFGAKEDIVAYLVQSIGYGLKLTNEIPCFCEKEPLKPLFTNPRNQEIHFSKQDKLQIDNNDTNQTQDVLIAVEDISPFDPKRDIENYRYPSLDLLNKNYSGNNSYIDLNEQTANKNRIIEMLRSYGVEISSIKATIGPIITLYEMTLAPGVRISKIISIEKDIIHSLCSYGARVIAPIPGKGTIGIEVPNPRPELLSLESILNTKKYQESNMDLPCAIGKTITNDVFMIDLAKAPHLIVTGSAGQGKTTCLNDIIISLLYKKHPAELKFVIIDTKQIELSSYNSLRYHFLAQLPEGRPIVTNVSDAIRTLKSICNLMEKRCDLLKEVGARNIREYNDKFIMRRIYPRGGHGYMPYIVMIIDELGDMMMEAGKETENLLLRLARLGRLVGIHMIISTRRPISTIITDSLNMEILARIVFKLSSSDSKRMINSSDAEHLIGHGDMLYMNGMEPIRIQSPFVDMIEVDKITAFISSQQSYNMPFELPDPDLPVMIDDDNSRDVDMAHLDPLFEDAARLVVFNQSGSTSLIQRKFAIGYNRAGRLMDQLEKAGIVGAAMGSKPREVLVKDESSLTKILTKIILGSLI